MKNFLFRLTHPSFWVQNAPSDPVVDKLINDAIDAGVEVRPETENIYRVYLGEMKVWVRNWPYNYGYIKGLPESLPYPLTRVKLRKYVMQKLAEQFEGDPT